MADKFQIRQSSKVGPLGSDTSVPLGLVSEALYDVLVDYNVPSGRVVAEFLELLADYTEAE